MPTSIPSAPILGFNIGSASSAFLPHPLPNRLVIPKPLCTQSAGGRAKFPRENLQELPHPSFYASGGLLEKGKVTSKSLAAPIAIGVSECRTSAGVKAQTILDFQINLSIPCTGAHTILHFLGNPMNRHCRLRPLSYLPVFLAVFVGCGGGGGSTIAPPPTLAGHLVLVST